VFEYLERVYRNAKYALREDWFSRRRFVELLPTLNFKSSPGYPMCKHYPTIGDFLKWDGLNYDLDRAEMLWSMVKMRAQRKDWDPWRVFIKDEPHKQEKVNAGRWRLIFAISLVDQIIERMLCYDQNQLEMADVYATPSKAGWAPVGGGSSLLKKWLRKGDEQVWLAIDKKAWDWEAPAWVFWMDMELRIAQNVRPDPLWEELLRSKTDYNFRRSKVVMSSGRVFEQKFDGLMKSGCFNTISTNSKAQAALHALTLSRMGLTVKEAMDWPIAVVGDDTLQVMDGDSVGEYVETLKTTGVTVKEVEMRPSFAGFDLAKDEPEYYAKHVVSLLYAEHLEESLESYQLLYACSPKLETIHGLIDRVCRERKLTKRTLVRRYMLGE